MGEEDYFHFGWRQIRHDAYLESVKYGERLSFFASTRNWILLTSKIQNFLSTSHIAFFDAIDADVTIVSAANYEDIFPI